MALAAYSSENKIQQAIQTLNCSVSSFAALAGLPGLGRTRITDALAGRNDFSTTEAEKLLAVVSNMEALQQHVKVPVAWERTAAIREHLDTIRVKRLLEQILAEEAGA